jgi:hypothetical protein
VAFDPHHQGWPCRIVGFCSGVWFRHETTLVCQCRHCRRLLAIAVAAVEPEPVPHAIPAGMWDPSLSTDLRPADDWPGCRD